MSSNDRQFENTPAPDDPDRAVVEEQPFQFRRPEPSRAFSVFLKVVFCSLMFGMMSRLVYNWSVVSDESATSDESAAPSVPDTPEETQPSVSETADVSSSNSVGEGSNGEFRSLFSQQKYDAARLSLYRSAGTIDPNRMSDRFQYRLALCWEGLGEWNKARQNYRLVVSHGSSQLKTVALVGQARIQLRRKQPALAKDLLRTFKQSPEIHRPGFADRLYVLALALVAEQTIGKWRALPDEPAIADVPPILPDSRLLDVEPAKFDKDQAEAINATIADVNQYFKTEGTDSDRLDDAEAILNATVAALPDHPLSKFAYVALGNLEFRRAAECRSKNLQAALGHYQRVIQSDAGIQLLVVASFNEGLAHWRIGDFTAARKALDVAANGIPGGELAASALLMIGRMWLDEGEFRRAIQPLHRAAVISSLEDEQGAAVCQLAIAHSLLGNNHEVGTALVRHREKLRPRTRYHAAAAFLNSYARYQTLTGGNREREATILMRSLSSLDNPKNPASVAWLGQPGVLLVGKAYRDLGLAERTSEIYSHALLQLLQTTAEPEMRFAVADFADANGNWPAAFEQFNVLAQQHPDKWARQSRLRLARHRLNQKNPNACLIACVQLLQDQSADRQQVLNLMAQAYEQQADYQRAAMCREGKIPPAKLETPTETPTETP